MHPSGNSNQHVEGDSPASKTDWPPLSIAVLAGGQSKRMGTDKALIPFGSEGRPLIARVLDVVEPITDDLMIVGPERETLRPFKVRTVPDLFPDAGALGGIGSALAAAMHAHCLIVSCDMPFLSSALLQEMCRDPRDYDVLIPTVSGESRQGGSQIFQTLHAIYARRCLQAIRVNLAEGQRQIIRIFPGLRVASFDEARIRVYDPEFRSFFSANTPESLAEAATLVSDMQAPGETGGAHARR